MARINIEEESWARVYRLAEILGISVREAVGTVACLWHRSQDLVQTHGTFEDLIEWASLSKLSDEDQKKWIAALEKSRFASRLNQDQFEVHGNKIQIENRISKTSKASKGGQALKKKLSQLKKFEAGLKPPSSRLGAGFRGLNAVQCKAEQSNAIQSKAKQYIFSAAAPAFDLSAIKDPENKVFFEKLKIKAVENWLKLYPVDWVDVELIKAIGWIHANPAKAPKSDFPKYFNSWLSRGWENFRKLPTNPRGVDEKPFQKIDWTNEAQIVWQTAKANGFSLSEKVREILGPDRVNLVKAAGGLYDLRERKGDSFTINDLAGKLKAAHEILSQQKGA